MLSRSVLERLSYAIAICLVVFGSVVPGREVAIGAGMGLLATAVSTKAIKKGDDD